jgi:hypothetical protein
MPRDGGIILAVGETRQQIEAIVEEDPFHQRGLADFRIIEFRKGMFVASTEPIPRIILPAVREQGDDKNAPIIERVYVSPYGPSKDGSRVSKKP